MTASEAESGTPDGSPSLDSSYDDVPYDSHAFAGTHPDHLATLAALFGVTAPDPDGANVLELGCASGGNLLPMAQGMPDAHFVGIDLSRRQIEDGLAIRDRTGLMNVDLQHRSITDVPPGEGPYDYVICHGVYSWVPPEVQQHIMRICRDNMTPGGVAYISYNTFPGWHMRAGVREMMGFHAARFDDPQSKIDQARALLDFLISAVPDDGTPYAPLLRGELEILHKRYDSYLFHEHLEEFNEPLYFYRFIERAAEASLRYLCEPGFESMTASGLPPGAAATLQEIAPDIIHHEQYLDFVRNRMFRRTLLVGESVVLDRAIGPERVRGMRAACSMKPPPGGMDLESEEPAEFTHAQRGSAAILKPLQKAALLELWESWPASIALEDLAELSLERLPGNRPALAVAQAEITELALTCFPSGMLELHLKPPRFVREAGERPEVPAFSRQMAERLSVTTNLRHESSQLEEIERRCLLLLDGRTTLDAVHEALVATVIDEGVTLNRDDEEITDPATVAALLRDTLPAVLSRLGTKALLRA